MLLRAVSGHSERQAVQKTFLQQMTEMLSNNGIENIGYPGGNTKTHVYVDRSSGLWFACEQQPKARVPRHWNAFGFYKEGRSQQISVEINIPIEKLTGQVAGAFAYHDGTGEEYLLHSGKIGGGAAGVGKTSFLVWSEGRLDWCDMVDTVGRTLPYIVVGRVGSADLPSRITRFVQIVAQFKTAVRNGELSNPAFERRVAERERYQREFSGQKTGKRKSAFDYFSYHGDVVEALRLKLVAEGASPEDIGNSHLIDLYRKDGPEKAAVYEVKTKVDRTSLYGGIGQLIVHSTRNSRKYLILPEYDSLPQDIETCLKNMGINVILFRLTGKKKKTISFH